MNTEDFTFFYNSNRNNTLITKLLVSRNYKHSIVEFESFNERVRTCGKSAIEKPRKRWLDNVENYLKKICLRGWRKIARDREAGN